MNSDKYALHYKKMNQVVMFREPEDVQLVWSAVVHRGTSGTAALGAKELAPRGLIYQRFKQTFPRRSKLRSPQSGSSSRSSFRDRTPQQQPNQCNLTLESGNDPHEQN